MRAAIGDCIPALIDRPGCVGGHLLRHEAPVIATTTEQKIRGADRYADWVFFATGYDAAALQALGNGPLHSAARAAAGAAPDAESRLYTLSHSATADDR